MLILSSLNEVKKDPPVEKPEKDDEKLKQIVLKEMGQKYQAYKEMLAQKMENEHDNLRETKSKKLEEIQGILDKKLREIEA